MEMTDERILKLADNLEMPLSAVTQKFAFLGRTGSGKTYAAEKLAELFLDAGAQVVVLDGIGVWYGLRLKADGKSKGYSIPVFGGEQGDVPLEPQAGKLIAKLIVDEGFSAVLDVSNFRKHERKTFVTDFAEELFHRKKTHRSALHFFCEESQMFIPERSGKVGARMLGAFEDLIKLGRNYGIGASLISQRPQAVNKEVLNQTEILLAFQMTGPHERKAIAAWVSDKGMDVNLVDELPSLKVGDAYVWSPQFLNVSERVHIAKKKTYDASSTPVVGAKTAQPRDLSPVDVEKIKASMADVVKRAEESDPRKLQARIRQLEAEIKKPKPAPAAAKVETRTKEVPVIKDAQLKRLETALAQAAKLADTLTDLREQIQAAVHAIQKPEPVRVPGLYPLYHKPAPPKPQPVMPKNRAAAGVVSQPTPAESGDLSGIHAKIVNALAELASFGVTQPNRQQISFYIGNVLTSGYGSRAVGELKTRGLVDYPAAGCLALTDAGRAAAYGFSAPSSLADFHDRIRRHLGGLHERIFNVLVGIYPNGVSREDLGGTLDVTLTSGYGSRTVGELKTAGLLIYPQPGHLQASDMLFPAGLS
jgi:hypothetical protein